MRIWNDFHTFAAKVSALKNGVNMSNKFFEYTINQFKN